MARTRVDQYLLAGESLVRAGIEHGAAARGERGGFVGRGQAIGGPLAHAECCGRYRRRPGTNFNVASVGDPCAQAAVEQGCRAAQHAQHHDQASGGDASGVVVRDYDAVVADSVRAHRRRERGGGREWVTPLAGGQVVTAEIALEIEPQRAG